MSASMKTFKSIKQPFKLPQNKRDLSNYQSSIIFYYFCTFIINIVMLFL